MKNPEPLIQIFCKAPVLGKVKTRLIQKLGRRGALDLYLQMFERLIAELSASRFNTELWISPDKDHAFFQSYAFARFQQAGPHLGVRMSTALRDGLNRHESVILVGTDLPLIDRSYIEQAVGALQTHDVVLGPAEDGGYGLVGVKAETPDMFSDIDWGTERVLSQTCARLNRDGLDFGLLPLIWDVDLPDDLPRYRAWLKGRGEGMVDQ
ncbi:MAG: glycosyltransferase [Gammaproteobacteria bacterium]|nr:glycosyltransferase [Gammaproteobacteria bacterium]